MGKLKQKAAKYADAFDGATVLADEAGRARKTAKIRAVLDAEQAFRSSQVRILDIGCSFGIILDARADAENLPFESGSFDIVICNHVYEHTDDAAQLLAEIRRVMHDDAVCYFAGPNKYEPVEPHYGLPFLSWLPRPLADRYMRLARKGESYPERPYSHRQLRRLLDGFAVSDYTARIVRDPVLFEATDILPPASFKRQFALAMHRFAPFFFPGFVYVLRKAG
jgi:SAM-dependent methyltransferase